MSGVKSILLCCFKMLNFFKRMKYLFFVFSLDLFDEHVQDGFSNHFLYGVLLWCHQFSQSCKCVCACLFDLCRQLTGLDHFSPWLFFFSVTNKFPFTTMFACSVLESMTPLWAGTKSWAASMVLKETSWCIKMPWRRLPWNLRTSTCPGSPLMG